MKRGRKVSSSKDLGNLLALARNSKGLSQREVADRLGVTQKWISEVEQGKPRAWIDKVLELSYFLGVQLFAVSKLEEKAPNSSDEPSIEELLSNEQRG